MKKLMIAAASAAMIGGAFAAGPVDGWEAYNFTSSLKTTKGVKANLKASNNDCLEENVTGYVRKQTTVKIDGLIWGCWCVAIADVQPFLGFKECAIDGSLFWNTTDKQGFDDFDQTAFAWDFINRIDTTARKTEGLWNAYFYFFDAEGTSVQSFELRGAGFGTAAGVDDEAYIPSISGYAVGTRWYTCGEPGAEKACGIPDAPVDSYVWALCDCADGDDATVAYGTWSIKWNQTLAKKLADNDGMDKKLASSYCKLAKFLDAADEVCAQGQEDERTPAEKAYDEAKKAFDEALSAYNEKAALWADATNVEEKAWNDRWDAQASAFWIAGSNETAKAFATLAEKRTALDVLRNKEGYSDLANAVATEAGNYWDNAQEYLIKDAFLQTFGGDDAETNEVATLKIKVENDDAVLKKAVADYTAGATVKTELTNALQAVYDAAKAYFDTAVKYVYLTSDKSPDYSQVSPWTTNELKKIAEAASVDAEQKEADRQDAENLMNVCGTALRDAKLICDALGGDCK